MREWLSAWRIFVLWRKVAGPRLGRRAGIAGASPGAFSRGEARARPPEPERAPNGEGFGEPAEYGAPGAPNGEGSGERAAP